MARARAGEGAHAGTAFPVNSSGRNRRMLRFHREAEQRGLRVKFCDQYRGVLSGECPENTSGDVRRTVLKTLRNSRTEDRRTGLFPLKDSDWVLLSFSASDRKPLIASFPLEIQCLGRVIPLGQRTFPRSGAPPAVTNCHLQRVPTT